MSSTRSDIAVIGAGPAGAWTAYLLASRGARVVVFDPSHPREKPCGGGVTGRALSIVSAAIGRQLPAVPIRSARFIDSATGRSASVPLGGGDSALVVASRLDFDGLLIAAAQRAGAELVAARAADLTRESAGWRIRASDGAQRTVRFVIGADGANGLVRRRVARAFSRGELSIATGFFAAGATSTEIVIEFTTDPPGYLWSFPRPDHLAIGICAQADGGATSTELRERVRHWIGTTGLARGARMSSYSWPIPSLSEGDLETLDMAGPGWLLVGDAAGLVDPVTREGIFFALQSAAIAADALSSHGTAEPARIYEARVRSELVSELSRAARFKSRFFQPRFIRLMVDALGESPRIRGVMADLISGSQGYRGLKRRLAGTLELRLALRALFG